MPAGSIPGVPGATDLGERFAAPESAEVPPVVGGSDAGEHKRRCYRGRAGSDGCRGVARG